jgi:hypothetical protein
MRSDYIHQMILNVRIRYNIYICNYYIINTLYIYVESRVSHQQCTVRYHGRSVFRYFETPKLWRSGTHKHQVRRRVGSSHGNTLQLGYAIAVDECLQWSRWLMTIASEFPCGFQVPPEHTTCQTSGSSQHFGMSARHRIEIAYNMANADCPSQRGCRHASIGAGATLSQAVPQRTLPTVRLQAEGGAELKKQVLAAQARLINKIVRGYAPNESHCVERCQLKHACTRKLSCPIFKVPQTVVQSE